MRFGCLLIVVAGGLVAFAAGARALAVKSVAVSFGSASALVAGRCAGSPIAPTLTPADSGEEVDVDVTASTASPAVHRLYETAALAVVERAATEKTALRIVAFGASGVGAKVLFAGSFAPVSADEVFNLAAVNREKCLARQAVAAAVETRPDHLGGSDIAGTLAAGITAVRAMVKPGGQATVTVLTDGCQAPAARGPNRSLTNLCGQLANAKTVTSILSAHRLEFGLPYARGVTIVIRGVGVGRNPQFANTLSAEKLVGFWTTVCRRAHAHACLIGSSIL